MAGAPQYAAGMQQAVAHPMLQDPRLAGSLVLQPGAMMPDGSTIAQGQPGMGGIPAGSYIVAPDGQVQGMIPHPQ